MEDLKELQLKHSIRKSDYAQEYNSYPCPGTPKYKTDPVIHKQTPYKLVCAPRRYGKTTERQRAFLAKQRMHP